MRRTIKAAAVALAATIAVMSGAAPAGADPVSVNDRVNKALVFLLVQFTGQVQVPFNDGPAWSADVQVAAVCTGYIVDPTGFIATAGHCVNASDESLKNELREQVVLDLAKKQNWAESKAVAIYQRALRESWPIRGGGGDGDTPSVSVKAKQASGPNQVIRDWTTLQVVASQPFKDGDNAILKLNSLPGPLTGLPIAKEPPQTGEAITSVGFPAQVRRVSDDVTLPQPSFKTGTVSSRQQNSAGVAQTEVSATLGKGMSGGPTVNTKGEVVGTNSMKTVSKDETSEFGFITDNVALRQFLLSNGATLTTAAAEPSGLNMWVWLGPLIGIVAILLILGLVLLLRRKPKSGPPPFYPGGGSGPGQPQFGAQPAFGSQPSFGTPQTPSQASGPFGPPAAPRPPTPGFGAPGPFPPAGPQQPGFPGQPFGR
ncbi:S1 family peptidase [Gordonia crocea]|uniref:S1 family peptidase n=1 Tax=Gordonia crocea TaxID=589162 RepID=UPI00137ABB5B|nr:serine protease [Gordonia crocea]